ncbi:MAG: HAD-IIIA family hydrolase [Verrucomicrobiae bacterium]|nr:HAD-IIIA family hydrolase [Verrucomicrobiae bacterium]
MAGSAPEQELKTAVFFDRDGVVNQSPGPGYVLNLEAFHLSPGLFDLIHWIKSRGWLAIVVTSQKGVGKGLMTQNELDRIHSHLQTELAQATGFSFDAIYAYTGTPDCPHRPKPDPEMVTTAAAEFGIDLAVSWLIGDADRDIEMAHAAGVTRTIRMRTEIPITVSAMATVDSLDEALEILRRQTA